MPSWRCATKTVARTRTTKKLAQRIDLNYFKRPTRFKRAKLGLSILLPLLALLWIAERTISKDSRVYSSGRMSGAHAVLETQCAACHVQQAGVFSAKAGDSACLACPDGPIHHEPRIVGKKELHCAECHSEHRGRVNLTAVGNPSCATCHADLRAAGGSPHYASNIRSFEDGHPELSARRGTDGAAPPDSTTIKLNHALHMKMIRSSPTGPEVQLTCGDCHRPAAANAQWKYGDANHAAAAVSYSDAESFLAVGSRGFTPHAPASGRELMAPVKFLAACSSCHLLTFDKRFTEGVPHDKPEVISTFLWNKYTKYIEAHPGELHEVQDPSRDLTGKPLAPRTRTVTAQQWIADQVAIATELLSHKTCAQCHRGARGPLAELRAARWASANEASGPGTIHVPAATVTRLLAMPAIAPANVTLRWMPHAKFDHDAHTGFTCVGCHEKALTSRESSDVLIPGIATCRQCHAPGPGHAESRCFECHTYHDWAKRREVEPNFTLPALEKGGL